MRRARRGPRRTERRLEEAAHAELDPFRCSHVARQQTRRIDHLPRAVVANARSLGVKFRGLEQEGHHLRADQLIPRDPRSILEDLVAVKSVGPKRIAELFERVILVVHPARRKHGQTLASRRKAVSNDRPGGEQFVQAGEIVRLVGEDGAQPLGRHRQRNALEGEPVVKAAEAVFQAVQPRLDLDRVVSRRLVVNDIMVVGPRRSPQLVFLLEAQLGLGRAIVLDRRREAGLNSQVSLNRLVFLFVLGQFIHYLGELIHQPAFQGPLRKLQGRLRGWFTFAGEH